MGELARSRACREGSHLWSLTKRPLLHLHSFLIQPTTSLKCLNRRMAMAPGVTEQNWSIRDSWRWRLPDADLHRSHASIRVDAPWPGWISVAEWLGSLAGFAMVMT